MRKQMEMFDCELSPDFIDDRSREERQWCTVMGCISYEKDGYAYIHLLKDKHVKLPILEIKIRNTSAMSNQINDETVHLACLYDRELKQIRLRKWMAKEADIEDLII